MYDQDLVQTRSRRSPVTFLPNSASEFTSEVAISANIEVRTGFVVARGQVSSRRGP